MIVIYRNGIPTVITGRRALLIMLTTALAFVVVAGLILGVELTVWTALMILFGLVAAWWQSRR